MTLPNGETAQEAAKTRLETSTWGAVDLGPYVRGEVSPIKPEIGWMRSDELQLHYPGKEHVVFGAFESGKSWWCLLCCKAEIENGNPVLYVHFEESSPQGTVDRLLELGVPGDALLERFHFRGPDEPAPLGTGGLLAEWLRPTLVILDGINQALSIHGWDGLGVDGPSELKRQLVNPFLKVGAAVIEADHVTHNTEKRGRGPYGGVHKGNKVDGSMILLEKRSPFGRGMTGRSSVYVTKDRPGFLRKYGKPTKEPGVTYMGELIIASHEASEWNGTPYLETYFTAPKRDEFDDVAVAESDTDVVERSIRTLIEDPNRECNLRGIRGDIKGISHGRIDNAIEDLKKHGRVHEESGKRGSRVFTVPQDPLP